MEVSALWYNHSVSFSTTAPRTTYSGLTPAKRRRRAPPACREAARRVPRRPEVGRPPNPRALSHPRGSREGNGGLGRWSAGPQAAPHSHIELIAMFRHQCLGYKWWRGVGWGGRVGEKSPPRAPGDPQVPSGVGWGARASRHRPTDLKFVPQSENVSRCEWPLS